MSHRRRTPDPLAIGWLAACLLSCIAMLMPSGCSQLRNLFGLNKGAEEPAQPAAGASAAAPAAPTSRPAATNEPLAETPTQAPPRAEPGDSRPPSPTEMMEAYWQAVSHTMDQQAKAAEAEPQQEPAAAAPTATPQAAASGAQAAAEGQPPRAAGPVMPVITNISDAAAVPAPAATVASPAAGPPLQQAAAVTPMPPASRKPAGAFDLQATIRLLEKSLAEPGQDDPSGRRLLSLLRLAAGDEVGALKDIPSLSKEDRELWSQLMWLNANVWGINQQLSPEGRAAESLVAMRDLEQTLRREAGLQIRNVKLCTKVVGYGVYTEMPEATFPAGQASRVIVYVEVDNFLSRQEADGQHHTKLQLRLQLFRKGSPSALWHKEYADIEDASFNQRRDLYVPVLIEWPATLAPGEHVLKVAVDDMLAGKTDERKVPIQFK